MRCLPQSFSAGLQSITTVGYGVGVPWAYLEVADHSPPPPGGGGGDGCQSAVGQPSSWTMTGRTPQPSKYPPTPPPLVVVGLSPPPKSKSCLRTPAVGQPSSWTPTLHRSIPAAGPTRKGPTQKLNSNPVGVQFGEGRTPQTYPPRGGC